MNIDFMRPTKLEASLKARGDVVKAGANLIFARSVIESDGKLIATASGTFYVTGVICLEAGRELMD